MLNYRLLNNFEKPGLKKLGFLLLFLCVQNSYAQLWQLIPGSTPYNERILISSINNDSLFAFSSNAFIPSGKNIVLNTGNGFVGVGKSIYGTPTFMKKVRGHNFVAGAHWDIVGCPNHGTGLGNDCGILCEYKNNSFSPLYSLQIDTVYVGSVVRDLIEYDNRIFIANGSCVDEFNLVYLDDSLNFIPIRDTLREDIKSLEVFKDTLFLAGSFRTNWQNAPADFFAYLDKSDYRVKPYGNSLNSNIFSIKAYKNEMYAIGWFNATSTDSIYGVAKMDSVTHKWKNVATKGLTTGGGFGQMLVFDNKLFMCGQEVSTIDTIKNCNNLVAWDGTKFKAYGLPGWYWVLSMCIFKDKLTVSGYDSLGYSFICQLVSDTGKLSMLGVKEELLEKSKWEINIFPNPSDGNITLTSNVTEKVSFEIFEISGKRIKEGTFKENLKLNNVNFAKGTYRIVFKNKNEEQSKSLIIQ